MPSPKHIRKYYETHGVEGYYEQFGDQYENPHFPHVRQLLINNKSRIDYTNVLDLGCGGGEVTNVLQELGYSEMKGIDPFTKSLYESQTNCGCLSWSFEDIISKGIKGEFSSIICSFAMHLLPEKQLFPLCYQLFKATNQLVIITPHKRPVLESIPQILLDFEDFVLTSKEKKVRLKAYKTTFVY